MPQTATTQFGLAEKTGPGVYQPIAFSDTADQPVALRTLIAGATGLVTFLRWNPDPSKADDTADAVALNVTAGQKIDIGLVRRVKATGTDAAFKATGGLAGAS
jgi:hypothetical protein